MKSRIEIIQDFHLPVERLFAYLAEHENMANIFKPARITRVRGGDTERNGVGSVRSLRVLMAPPFEETVTAYRVNECIEYRITKGSPLKNHQGVMRFSALPDGSRLHYTIEFEGKLPLIATVVKIGLERSIRAGLKEIG
ncbi:MAG TPA: SRPBCC family protein [bacterium]|nr:SRPBCC family protein [bacterium]